MHCDQELLDFLSWLYVWLGDDRLESSPAESDVGVLADSKLSVSSSLSGSQEANCILQCIQHGIISYIVLLCSELCASSTVCTFGHYIMKGYKTIREHPKEGCKKDEGTGEQEL